MLDVAIISAGMIPFGRRDEDSLMDRLAHAGKKASLPKTLIGDCFVENHVTQLNTLSAASYG